MGCLSCPDYCQGICCSGCRWTGYVTRNAGVRSRREYSSPDLSRLYLTARSSKNTDDCICITDMAKAKSSEACAADVIKNRIRSRTTPEFLGTWELLYNPDFKVVEFDHFRMQGRLPTFTLSVGEWIEKNQRWRTLCRTRPILAEAGWRRRRQP